MNPDLHPPRFLAASARTAALLFLAAGSSALSQHPAARDYSKESSVIDSIDRVYTYAADGTGFKEVTGVVEIRDQAAVKGWSVLSFNFASGAEHVQVDYVRVRRPDGTLIPTPAADAQELPAAVTREAPFYSDIKEEQIPVRSISPGDHLEYKFHIIRTRPEAPNHFWGEETFFTPSSGTVILSESVDLHVPKDAYIKVWSPKLKPTSTDTPTERIYHWQSSQLEPVAGKDHNTLLRMEKDPALLDETEPHLPAIAWTNFRSWAEVGAWYRSMEGARTDPDDDIRAKVKDLIAGKSTDADRARAIYDFVGPQIRYIGVAFGVGRYQPHEAGEVLRNQYGDCKDKTTLLISMLSAAGISADAVLIGAGVAFNLDVPSPGSFNHAINLVHIDAQPVWLDSTAEIAPFRMLNPQLRGRQALVVPLTGEAHIETTPKESPFPSIERFEATGSLDDKGTSHSHIVMDLRGDAEIGFRATVRQVSPAQWDELMQHISQAMNYAGKVTHAEFSRPENTIDPFHIASDYEREKAGDWENHRILPQIPPFGLPDVDEKDPPVSPIQLGFLHTEISHSAMKLPPGWSAQLPPAIHARTQYISLDKTYRFENGTLTTDRRIDVLAEKIPASDWRVFHQWYKDAGLENEPYVQLVAPSALAPPQVVSPAATNQQAADLVHDAYQASKSNNLDTMQAKLDAAKAINPNQPGLWAQYAALAKRKGNSAEALADWHRELDNYPEVPGNVVTVAQLEVARGNTDEAIAALQSAIARDPTNAQAVLYLSSLLDTRLNFTAAEKVLRAGLQASPSNIYIKIRLGINLLHQYKPDEGEPILRDVISTSNEPGPLNDAAYELADASLDLPLAEKAAHHALELLDALTTNGETGPVALRRTNLLVHVWDTYGWILYRENKLAEAEPWITAAWRNGNTAEVGYHLAVLLDLQHQPAAALAQLRLASTATRGSNAAQVDQLIVAKTAELEKVTGIDPGGSNTGLKMRLQEPRTYQIEKGSLVLKGNGSAIIELDVSTKGTTAVRFVEGDPTLEPLFEKIRQVDLFLSIPPESHASLLRRGILKCSTRPTCELLLLSPSGLATQR